MFQHFDSVSWISSRSTRLKFTMIWRDHKIPPDNRATCSPVSYEEWARPFTRFICSTCLDKQLLRRWIFLLIHASRIISFHQSRVKWKKWEHRQFYFLDPKSVDNRRTLPIQSQKCIGQIFQKFFPENKSDDPYGRPRDSVCTYLWGSWTLNRF